MKSISKILVCGKDSTSGYLSQQLKLQDFNVVNVSANPLDIICESYRSMPSAVIFSSVVEQPVKLIDHLKGISSSPKVFVIKSQKEIFNNSELEEKCDGCFDQPLDIEKISQTLQSKISNSLTEDNGNEETYKVLYNYISQLLNELCVTANYNGYLYLREAIKIVSAHPVSARGFSTKIYPHIADKFNVKTTSVERNIRTAINRSWDKAQKETKVNTFGVFAANDKWRPTNSEYILILADMVSRKFDKIV
ncbi:MAG: sporulation initiation factor Spo0A C-terminal domain-containing protein [Oscillospiraceae bacterium]